ARPADGEAGPSALYGGTRAVLRGEGRLYGDARLPSPRVAGEFGMRPRASVIRLQAHTRMLPRPINEMLAFQPRTAPMTPCQLRRLADARTIAPAKTAPRTSARGEGTSRAIRRKSG